MSGILNPTLRQLTIARRHFCEHYTSISAQPFSTDIRVNWQELLDCIEKNVMWELDETILRFFHRFYQGFWFLTVEPCRVSESGLLDQFGQRFDLIDKEYIRKSDFQENYDVNYFNNLLYDKKPLVQNRHVNYVMMPWVQEFKAGALINDVEGRNGCNIVFSSCSFDYSNSSSSRVTWPHTIAFYFSDPINGDLLDNNLYEKTGTMMPFKAFDYNSLCPTVCGFYEWPDFFEWTNKARVKDNTFSQTVFPACPIEHRVEK